MVREAGFSGFEALDWESDMNACECMPILAPKAASCAVVNAGQVESGEQRRRGALRFQCASCFLQPCMMGKPCAVGG